MALPGQFVRKYAPAALVLLWAAAQVWFLRDGPRVVYDSHRYLGYAQQLTDGWGIGTTHNVRYLGYAAYLSIFQRLGLGLWPMVLGQVLLNGLATLAFYRAMHRLAPHDWRPAVLATALVVAWPDLQRFNAYLLTESLFASTVMLTFWIVMRVRHWSDAWLTLPPLVLAIVLRPNGFLVPIAVLAAGFRWAWQRSNRKQRLGLLVGIRIIELSTVFLINPVLRTYHVIETYARGQIIGGYKAWLVYPTAPLVLPAPDRLPLVRMWLFMWEQPGFFFKLAGFKLLAFMAYVKPYWSMPHQVVGALVIWPAWLLAGWALRIASPGRLFLGTLLIGQASIVLLTIENWDSRFLTPLLPALFALAALGVPWRRA